MVWLISCNEKSTKQLFVVASSKEISIDNDIVYHQKKTFTGILFELQPNNKDTLFLQTYKNGLLDGVAKKWFPNHQLMEYREYKLGRKNGLQKAFWDNGNKRFEFNAVDDAYEGEMKEWSVNGHLFHWANYKNGQEEGSQKMWYENGKIRANYVIVNGKRYGLLGTKNCKNVSDSIFIVK
jgi:antitoxin component YwqK of YwqJK toxin-antitoxin module